MVEEVGMEQTGWSRTFGRHLSPLEEGFETNCHFHYSIGSQPNEANAAEDFKSIQVRPNGYARGHLHDGDMERVWPADQSRRQN